MENENKNETMLEEGAKNPQDMTEEELRFWLEQIRLRRKRGYEKKPRSKGTISSTVAERIIERLKKEGIEV